MHLQTVRRIMNNCNASFVSSLRGTCHTVEQLVKVGSVVERDRAAKKEFTVISAIFRALSSKLF